MYGVIYDNNKRMHLWKTKAFHIISHFPSNSLLLLNKIIREILQSFSLMLYIFYFSESNI